MYYWQVRYQTFRPMATMPRMLSVARERALDATYRNDGRLRQSEQHCVFQYTISGEGRFRDASGTYVVPAGQGFLCAVYDQ
jgi:hypothetical protein